MRSKGLIKVMESGIHFIQAILAIVSMLTLEVFGAKDVYSFAQAVRELNLKAKNLKDLLTDESFTRSDIITIQDPNNVDKSKLLSEFDHVKQNRAVKAPDAQADPIQSIRMSEDHKRVFQSLNTDEVRQL